MKYRGIREEELKNKIADSYFVLYDCTKIIGNVDFAVCLHQDQTPLLEEKSLVWGEAKKGASDIYKSFTQLILTIGKARTFDKHLPPDFLTAFDGEKMAFIPYNAIQHFFYQNDFNWTIAPSNHQTKEFQMVQKAVEKILNNDVRIYYYEKDDKELKTFIKNFANGKYGQTKIKIDKNNFVPIYNKWLATVKPTIRVNWDSAKKNGIIDGDFYLADLLSHENKTLKEKLYVLLQTSHYELDRIMDDAGFMGSKKVDFYDNQNAHHQFWNRYERPPKNEYWDYIVERRDLLVPQDIRERKGSFFTPSQWVALSQQYLADILGEDWQDEYVVWDPAAGTGNLLAGLTNKYNLWASTLDKQDVDVMKDRIKNGANLLEAQVFQFDFLNDDFTKLPRALQTIINDPAKRKKLVIYMNPPYADASSNLKTSRKAGNSFTKMHAKYKDKLGSFARELYAHFLTRIYLEMHGCIIAEFSKLKMLSVSHAEKMRHFFEAKLQSCFLVPADTFDNVEGKFPIGFKIWDTKLKTKFTHVVADVYDEDGNLLKEKKNIYSYDDLIKINRWLSQHNVCTNIIGYISMGRNDFQNSNLVYITAKEEDATNFYCNINSQNLIISAIYLTVYKIITPTWLNDRDQFLSPHDGWQNDIEFHNDCLIYCLFHGSNNITSKDGINHWIPFAAQEVGANGQFDSTFMSDFIAGKLPPEQSTNLELEVISHRTTPLKFSPEASAVFSAGKKLWTYYHKKSSYNINASFYDIREFFQGRNQKTGRMNIKSTDETYTELIDDLRQQIKNLAKKIEPKIYQYGFLKK